MQGKKKKNPERTFVGFLCFFIKKEILKCNLFYSQSLKKHDRYKTASLSVLHVLEKETFRNYKEGLGPERVLTPLSCTK